MPVSANREQGMRAAPTAPERQQARACLWACRGRYRNRKRGIHRSCIAQRNADGWEQGGSSNRRPSGNASANSRRAFSFDEHDGFPNVVGEGSAAAIFIGFADTEFCRAADIETAGLAEALEETIDEDLGLTFFIAGDVLLT